MKSTIQRTVKLKDCKKDFGLGPGILYRDELTVEAMSEIMLSATILNKNNDLKDSLLEIEMKELQQ